MITKFFERKDGRVMVEARAEALGCGYAADLADAWQSILTTDDRILGTGDVVAVANVAYPRNDLHKRGHVILSSDPAELTAGFGGNMDPTVRKFHGWRGTTCDAVCTAYGVRMVEKIDARILADDSARVRVLLGRDLVADKD